MSNNSFFIKNFFKLTEIGENYKNNLKDIFRSYNLTYMNSGCDKFEILFLCNMAIQEVILEQTNNIENFINNNKDFEILEIINKSTNEKKIAIFEGYTSDGNKIWKYEEDFIPIVPYLIISIDNNKYFTIPLTNV